MAGGRIAGITIDIGGNTTKLQDALKGVNKSIKETQTQLRDVNKLLKVNPGNTDLLKQKQELLTKSIEDTKAKLEQEKQALEQLKNADGSEKTKAQQEALTREIIATENQLEQLEAEYKEFGSVAQQQTKAAGEKMQEVGGNIKAVGDKITGVGTAMTTHVTAPIMAVGAASLAAFEDVDKGMDIVITKTGATGEALESMENIVKDIATSIPTSFEEAGAAVGEVNTRFGVTGEELEKLSTQFIEFAKINGTDVNGSIDNVQKAMAAFGLEAKDAGAFLDTLNKVGQDTGVSVDSLTALMVTNGTALQSMGYSASDAATLLGQLDKAGVDASTVMTGFSKVQKAALDEGVSMQDKFAEALSSSEAAIDTFGAKAGPKLYESFQNGTLSMDMFTAGATNLNDALGSVEETFNATVDPTDQLAVAFNELKLVGAEIGEVLQGQLAPIIQTVTEALRGLKEWFTSLDDSTKQTIVTIAAVVAAIGPVVAVIGTIVSAVGTVISVVGSVTSAISGAIGVITTIVGVLGGPLTIAIAAVVAAGVLLYKNWETVKQVATSLAQIVAQKFQEIQQKVTPILTAIGNAVKSAFDAIKNTVTSIMGAVGDLISTKLGNIKSAFDSAGGGITGVVSAVMTTIKEVWTTGLDLMNTLTGGALDGIKSKIDTGFEAARTTIVTAMNTITSAISSAWNAIMGVFKLPHFTVSGTLDLKSIPPKLPSLGIEWYAKAMHNGMILNKPTLFGAGEAGAEAIIGVNSLQSLIKGAVSESVTNYGGVNVTVYGAPGQSEEKLAEIISRRINSEVARKGAAWR